MRALSATELRREFLSYFAANQHTVVKSSSLVPANDPTLYFTNAGMVQFKDIFTGREPRPYARAVSSQKCMRVSGKHNDLDNVGRTARHHTLFEMLGNFSFGDYFKREAIEFAWQFLTGTLAIPESRLTVTVFETDDEAFALWRDVIGVPESRITRMGAADNFWAMGDTGPCGPCSGVYFDKGPDAPEDERIMEIWNLVFMQFNRSADGTQSNLPAPSVDTGMGLERIASALQGFKTNYDTDLFQPVIQAMASRVGKRYTASDGEDDVSLRVIADHARAAAFLIGDGVLPGNDGREYVLRRIMRRAIRHGKRLGFDELFYHHACNVVVDTMGGTYPELEENRAFIEKVVMQEEERFRATLDRGLRIFHDIAASEAVAAAKVIPGEAAFKLKDTYGFPLDLTEQLAIERGYSVDGEGFKREEEAAKARSEWAGSGEKQSDAIFGELRARLGVTEFVGYPSAEGDHRGTTSDGTIVALVVGGVAVQRVEAGAEVAIVTDRTPFYGESGGQWGDAGVIALAGSPGVVAAEVRDTKKPADGLHVHLAKAHVALAVGDHVTLTVDGERRDNTRRHHSATHLLHLALRETLGEHVRQAGSLVTADRLRFDYAHFESPTPEQLDAIEVRVNALIRENNKVATVVTDLEAARAAGAMALFGEKYGDVVRMVRMGPSTELCGGTHVARTGDIGLFRIVGESAVAAGVRRLEAVTGGAAIAAMHEESALVRRAAQTLKAAPGEMVERLERLVKREKDLLKAMDDLKRQIASGAAGGGASGGAGAEFFEVGGVKVLVAESRVADAKILREAVDRARDKDGAGVVLYGANGGDKALFVCGVAAALSSKLKAGDIVREVAAVVGGKGGGRPDFAQAGGPDVAKLGDALARAKEIISAALS